MDAIEIQRLVKTYGAHKAVDSVNLNIGEGECFGLLGTNGAGKSTLLNIVAGLLSQTSGQVSVLGHDVMEDWREVKSRMGHCFGFSNFLGNMTGRENLRIVGYAHDMSDRDIDQRVDELAQAIGLAEIDKKASDYSSGMTQKLALIAGLMHDPEILLVDELTVGLDVPSAKRIRRVLASLKDEKTIVLTTHYMGEAEELCDRIGLMHRGRLAAVGAPAELTRSIKNEDVLELQTSDDAAAMRLVGGRCSASEDGLMCRIERDELGEILMALLKQGLVVKKVAWKEPTLEEVLERLEVKK